MKQAFHVLKDGVGIAVGGIVVKMHPPPTAGETMKAGELVMVLKLLWRMFDVWVKDVATLLDGVQHLARGQPVQVDQARESRVEQRAALRAHRVLVGAEVRQAVLEGEAPGARGVVEGAGQGLGVERAGMAGELLLEIRNALGLGH